MEKIISPIQKTHWKYDIKTGNYVYQSGQTINLVFLSTRENYGVPYSWSKNEIAYWLELIEETLKMKELPLQSIRLHHWENTGVIKWIFTNS